MDSYGAGFLVLQNALGYIGLGEFIALEFRARPRWLKCVSCLLLASCFLLAFSLSLPISRVGSGLVAGSQVGVVAHILARKPNT